MSEALERVRGILVEQLGVDEDQVTEDASFQGDLDADSLDLVELIMELEDQFGVKISDEDAQKIETVGQAVDYVTHARLSDGGGRGSSGPLIDALPAEARRAGVHALLLGRASARGRTNGSSSSATACWRCRSPSTCTARFPDRREGDLARFRANVVSRPSCAAAARGLGLARDAGGGGRRRGGEAAATRRCWRRPTRCWPSWSRR